MFSQSITDWWAAIFPANQNYFQVFLLFTLNTFELLPFFVAEKHEPFDQLSCQMLVDVISYDMEFELFEHTQCDFDWFNCRSRKW